MLNANDGSEGTLTSPGGGTTRAVSGGALINSKVLSL